MSTPTPIHAAPRRDYASALRGLRDEPDERLDARLAQRMRDAPQTAALATPAGQAGLLRLALEGYETPLVAHHESGATKQLTIAGGLVATDERLWGNDVNALSWAEMRLVIGGRDVLTHFDGRETRDSVRWYSLPLLQWLGANWRDLFETGGASHLAPEGAFGPFPAPHVSITRWVHQAEIGWRRAIRQVPYMEFSQPGDAIHLDATAIAAPLRDWAVQILKDLRERTSSDEVTQLLADFQRLPTFEGSSRRWERSGAMQPNVRRVLERLGLSATSPLFSLPGAQPGALKLAFGSASPTLTETDVAMLVNLGHRAAGATAPSVALEDARRFVPLRRRREPWRQGYRLAMEYHKQAGLDIAGVAPVDVHAVYAELGISVESIVLDDCDVRGVTLAVPGHSPLVTWNQHDNRNSAAAGRRFTLAHELCHVLYDGGTKRPLGLVDGPWAPEGIEQRANSFAAMFLMPLALVDRLRDELGRPTIDRLADAVVSGLHVSQRTAREHVLNIDKNRHLIDDT